MNMIPQFLMTRPWGGEADSNRLAATNAFRVPPRPDAPVDVPLPSRTEDDAIAAVGFHDAMAAENLAALRQYETTLAGEIEDKQEALGIVQEAIARLNRQHAPAPAPAPKPDKRKKVREVTAA